MRGILLAGGTGSRLQRLTKITNKHLLPIYDRSDGRVGRRGDGRGGITEVLIVTGGEHVGDFLRILGDGHELGLEGVQYTVQERPGGIAEALGLGERFARGGPVVVMLADNIFEQHLPAHHRGLPHEPGRLPACPHREWTTRRTCATSACPSSTRTAGSSSIIEKPEIPPSHYAVTGLYCYGPDVFDVVKTLKPSGRGELEVTDLNNHYVSTGSVAFDVQPGFWGDAGESDRGLPGRRRVRGPQRGQQDLGKVRQGAGRLRLAPKRPCGARSDAGGVETRAC